MHLSAVPIKGESNICHVIALKVNKLFILMVMHILGVKSAAASRPFFIFLLIKHQGLMKINFHRFLSPHTLTPLFWCFHSGHGFDREEYDGRAAIIMMIITGDSSLSPSHTHMHSRLYMCAPPMIITIKTNVVRREGVAITHCHGDPRSFSLIPLAHHRK